MMVIWSWALQRSAFLWNSNQIYELDPDTQSLLLWNVFLSENFS